MVDWHHEVMRCQGHEEKIVHMVRCWDHMLGLSNSKQPRQPGQGTGREATGIPRVGPEQAERPRKKTVTPGQELARAEDLSADNPGIPRGGSEQAERPREKTATPGQRLTRAEDLPVKANPGLGPAKVWVASFSHSIFQSINSSRLRRW